MTELSSSKNDLQNRNNMPDKKLLNSWDLSITSTMESSKKHYCKRSKRRKSKLRKKFSYNTPTTKQKSGKTKLMHPREALTILKKKLTMHT